MVEVGKMVLGLATSHDGKYKVQVRFHPNVVWSSLARTDNHGFLAPCETTKHVLLHSLIGKFDRIEILHLFRCFTHTRPAAAGLFRKTQAGRGCL